MEPRISLITLGVSDIERARRFYVEGLGWPASSASGGNVVFLRTGGAVLSLYLRENLAADANLPNERSAFGGITLAHNVPNREDVDAALAEAEAAGATIIRPGGQAEWGGYIGYFTDPDGHPWEVAWNPFFPLDSDGTVQLPE